MDVSMTTPSNATPSEPHLPIGAVERETGLPKDTLRIWERRYGFPQPLRDAAGERLYTAADVEKLRLVKRLADQGHRPSKLIGASNEALSALLNPSGARDGADLAQQLLPLVRVSRVDELRARLTQHLLQDGLIRFICDTIAPLNRLVGEAWLRGELQVPDEHMYSELISNLLRATIGAHLGRGSTPRILLTTVPEESHGLGLLMAEAVMTAEGAMCVSLGMRTPLTDIRRAALDGHFDVVALSFSARCAVRSAVENLKMLRRLLPDEIEIWAGGSGVRHPERLSLGVHAINSITGAQDAVRDWRKRHPKSRS